MSLKDLNAQLAERAYDLCMHLLPNGKREANRFLVGSIAGDAGKSLQVQLDGTKAGRWKDFASDEGGDLIALIEQVKSLSPIQAADFARQFLGLPAWEPDRTTPPPFDPLRFGFKRKEEKEWRYPSQAWTYRDANGMPFAWVARFDGPDGKKDVMPIRIIEGKHRWKGWTGNDPPPIYGLDKLARRPDAPVLIVEGEKAADAASKLFPDFVCITWQGGTPRVQKADWVTALRKATKVILWPDADAPGRKAMVYLRTLIEGSHMVATKELPEGWDLADEPPEDVSPAGLLAAAMMDRKQADPEEDDPMGKYHLPRGCELSKVEPDLLKYRVMEHAAKVWGLRGTATVEVSNCTIEIHQHIITKDGALVLVTLHNQQDNEAITMDVPFDTFSTSLSFIKLLGNRGNFQWWGTEADFTGYKRMLMDRMGKGRIITELGGQPEGFFVFSNAMVNGSVSKLDKHGCFQHEDQRYYVPAGNTFYMGDVAEFTVQKRLRISDDHIDFGTWCKQMVRVFGEHAYMAIAFTLATAFSGHIFQLLDGFPLLFFHGPGGSGKDKLIKCCQGIYGRPQPEIFLSGPNTDKGLIKMFAEFTDVPMNMAEYRNGLKKDMDELLKSMWGRIGYRLAAMRGKRTETIPINCTAFVSGNDYPNRDNALMRRLLIDEIEKKAHSDQDIREFQTLEGMLRDGYSNIFAEFYKHRPAFLATWYQDHYKASRPVLLEAMGGTEVDSSILMNMQVLHATMRFFADKLPWAFHTDDLAGYMAKAMRLQLEKRSEGSEVANFWTCFAYAWKKGVLVEDRDYKLTGDSIMFYWGDVFGAYSAAHMQVFGEKGEKPTDMRTKLARHPCWEDALSSGRIGTKNSSAIVCNMEKTGTNLRHMLTRAEDKFADKDALTDDLF